jgi:hypothetical protein
MAVAYLVQHLSEDADRLPMLIDTLRKEWDRINEEETAWFAEFWPDAFPDGPESFGVSSPSPQLVRQWSRDPLLNHVPGPGHEGRRSPNDR